MPIETEPPMVAIHQFTVDDLASFPDDGNRYEVIEGELYVSAAPHFDHQLIVDAIGRALWIWDPDTRYGITVSGAGLIFSPVSGVVPDVVWVSTDQYQAVLIDPHTGQRDGKLHAAPTLVIEVVSPGPVNARRDRETKLRLYSRYGVREYWIVDPAARSIALWRRGEAALLELAATLLEEDVLTSPRLPGFELPVARIFQLPPGVVKAGPPSD
jgi:Uma2 family endonuclease